MKNAKKLAKKKPGASRRMKNAKKFAKNKPILKQKVTFVVIFYHFLAKK